MAVIGGFLGFAVFIITNLFCISYSRKALGTSLNITTVLAAPYLLICIFQVLMVICGNFDSPTLKYWLILSFFILMTLVFEIISNYTLLNIKNKNIRDLKKVKLGNNTYNLPLTIIVSIFLILVLYNVFVQISNVRIGLIFQDSFQSDFENSFGGNFYSRVALMFFAAYFLSCQNKKYGYILGILCFIPNIVVNTKGIILIPILSIFFANILYRRTAKIVRNIVIPAIMGIVVFFGSYLLQYYAVKDDAISDSSILASLFGKFINYSLAGVQSFSYNISKGTEYLFYDLQNCTLAPFNSILANIGLTNSYSPVNPIFVSYGNIPNYGILTSNVNTYIGTLYLFNGLAGGCAIHFFWVFITSCIRVNAFLMNNSFLVILFCLFLSGFALGWFEFYFMHTFWLYMIILVVILSIGFRRQSKLA